MASYSMYSRKLICILMTICGLPVLSDMSDHGDELYYNTTTGVRCIKCPPGFSFVEDCKPVSPNSTQCEPCPDGRFSPEWNIKLCQKCTPSCQGKNEIIVLSCNRTHDIKCGCTEGYFHDNHNDPSASKCIEYTKCAEGLGAQTPVPRYKDLTCVRCVPGKNFSDVTSYSSCQTCRDCLAEGLNIIKNCTVKSNTVCDIKTTRPPATQSTPTSTPTAETSAAPDEKNDTNVIVIVVVVILVVFIVIVIVIFCLRKTDLRKKYMNCLSLCRNGSANLPPMNSQPASTVNSMAELNVRQLRGTRHALQNPAVNSDCNVRTPLAQRRLSLTAFELGQGVRPIDIYLWLSQNLGDDYTAFIRKLPGETLTQTEWGDPSYRKMGLSDTIVFLLETWREKNSDIPDEQLLTEFHQAAYTIGLSHICDGLKTLALPVSDNVLD